MRPSSPVTRAQFLRYAAGGLFGSFAIVTAACGGDDDDGPATDAPPAADGPDPDAPPAVDAPPEVDAPPGVCTPEPTIASNHGHTLTIAAADVTAGQARTYDITGGAGHAHAVTLTAAHFQMLQQNQPVTVTSTSAGHTHSVTVRCA